MPFPVRSTWKRILLAFWILPGSVLLACWGGGFCTDIVCYVMPRDASEKILAATVKPDDILVLDCVMRSGNQRRFEADLRGDYQQDAHECGVPDEPLPLSARPLRLKDQGVEIPRQTDLAAGPIGQRRQLPVDAVLTIATDNSGSFTVKAEGAERLWLVGKPEIGRPLNWSRLDTYGLCALFPVAFAVDIVTLPIQLWWHFYGPKC